MNLKELIGSVTNSPGVYLMKDKQDVIIYVGKAKNLRKRLVSYFDKSQKTNKTKNLVKNVKNIETIVTNSESEALLLELNLVQKYKPKFNIKLKNTPNYYPYIAINENQEYPFFEFKFHKKEDLYTYFGPFPNKGSVYKFTTKLNDLFKLRTCSNFELKNRTRPCIKYETNVCAAPCMKYISKKEYQINLNKALSIMNGNISEFKEELIKKMQEYSDSERFEEAGKVRDQLKLIEDINKSQSVISSGNKDQYFINISRESAFYYIGIMKFEKGKMNTFESYAFEDYDLLEESKVYLEKFIIDYFSQKSDQEIIVNEEINKDLEKEMKLTIRHPKNQQEIDSLSLILKNIQRTDLKNISDDYLEKIKEELNLIKTPFKIECFDISHFQGSSVVGAKVSYINDEMDKKNYKYYKLSKEQNNDFDNIYEVVFKRFSDKKDSLPELLLIDGGLGQLNAANRALNDLNIQGVEVRGIAKSRIESDFKDKEINQSSERVVDSDGSIIQLDTHSISYKIIVKIRNEAHKSAISFHRKLKSKNLFK